MNDRAVEHAPARQGDAVGIGEQRKPETARRAHVPQRRRVGVSDRAQRHTCAPQRQGDVAIVAQEVAPAFGWQPRQHQPDRAEAELAA